MLIGQYKRLLVPFIGIWLHDRGGICWDRILEKRDSKYFSHARSRVIVSRIRSMVLRLLERVAENGSQKI